MINKIYEKTKEIIKENKGFILTLIILYILGFVNTPYVIEIPGSSIDLKERIEVEGAYETEGSLEMAYVTMVDGKPLFLIASFILPDWDIVKKGEILYEDETLDDRYNRDRIMMEQANIYATINAYKNAGEEITITSTTSHIIYIDQSVETELKIGDEIISVEGIKVKNQEEVTELIKNHQEGDVLEIKITRDDKEKTVTTTLKEIEDAVRIGISLAEIPNIETEIPITIKTEVGESGPSGGLITSLMIYNGLTEEDLTDGQKIIGTGTIDEEGNVGIIGGVKYKLIGAVKNEADIFICPEENLEEALQVKKDKDYDIEIIGVSTFQEAITALN